jgi:DNA-binding XRE family transcriptional regulator
MGEALVLAVQCVHRGPSSEAGKGKRGSAAGRAKFFKELGRRIRELRVKAGYTQANMVNFGFSMRHWQQIERGRPISVTTLLRICEVFKIKPEDLLRDLEPG